MEKLEADGFTCKDIALFSVGLALLSLFNAACLRPDDFNNLLAKTLYYDRPLDKIMIGLPEEGKQTEVAEKSPANACFQYGVEGAEVVRWWVVMSLVGRPFLKKHNGGEVDSIFGPLAQDGKALSNKEFGEAFLLIGKSFFGVPWADVAALRTVQNTLAAEHLVELGLTPNAVCARELAQEQRVSMEVSHVYREQRTCVEVRCCERQCRKAKVLIHDAVLVHAAFLA